MTWEKDSRSGERLSFLNIRNDKEKRLLIYQILIIPKLITS